jgi:hypothetical protein
VPEGNINRLLNRLLAVPVEMQGQVFGHFSALTDALVAQAKKNGT